MKVTNETDYQTDQLRDLCQRVCKLEGDRRGNSMHFRFFKMERRDLPHLAGALQKREWLSNYLTVDIYLSKKAAGEPWSVAALIARGCVGDEHVKDYVSDNGEDGRYSMGREATALLLRRAYYDWTLKIGLDFKPVPSGPELSLQRATERLLRVNATVERWQAKVKRAHNALRKWTRKQKALERRVNKLIKAEKP